MEYCARRTRCCRAEQLATGRVALEGRPCTSRTSRRSGIQHRAECQRTFGGRTVLGVPLLREGDDRSASSSSTATEVGPFTDKQIELYRPSPPRPSSPSRTRGCSTNCASAPTTHRVAGAADRDHRSAQGHQPFALRPAAGVRHHRAKRLHACARRRLLHRCRTATRIAFGATASSPESDSPTRGIRSLPRRGTHYRTTLRSTGEVVHIPDVTGRPGLHCSRGAKTRRGYRRSRCAANARGRCRSARSRPRRERQPFTDKQIELVEDLRRPGGHRHRERAAVRRDCTRSSLAQHRPRRRKC